MAYVIFGLGTAGVLLENDNGDKFPTKDQDNDMSTADCGANVKGAWCGSFDCRDSHLNSVYRMRALKVLNGAPFLQLNELR